MGDVAKAAGVRRQVLYEHFNGRDDLILAVTTAKVAVIHERTRQVVDAEPGVPDGLVEGLLYSVTEALADPFINSLHVPDEVGFTTRLATSSELIRDAAAQMWVPVLQAGQRQGSIRQDLDLELTTLWFVHVTMMLLATHATGVSDPDTTRELLRRMFLPALVDSHGLPGSGADRGGDLSP